MFTIEHLQIGSDIMENRPISIHSDLFHQALYNPLAVSEADLLTLIVKFPYVQSLRFAYERQLYLNNSEVHNISSTLLYAANPNWLYEYLHKASPVVEKAVVEEEISDDYVTYEDVEADETVDTIEEDTNIPAQDELEKLIQSGATQDFFRMNKKEDAVAAIIEDEEFDAVEIASSAAVQISPIEHTQEEERISVYDDELLPYSFLWWLHKTRMEHAHTYQPFVKAPVERPQPSQHDIDRFKNHIDAQVLDQQIRENIFHLQSPEVKLSDEVKNTVPFQVQKKNTDDLIEKFIKEDPQIKPPAGDKINLENKARRSSEDQYSLVTETLARIYIEQGLFPKAIEVYKKLVLKYPEKNAYFAAEILKLEKKLT